MDAEYVRSNAPSVVGYRLNWSERMQITASIQDAVTWRPYPSATL